jgi:hypothetical protein
MNEIDAIRQVLETRDKNIQRLRVEISNLRDALQKTSDVLAAKSREGSYEGTFRALLNRLLKGKCVG